MVPFVVKKRLQCLAILVALGTVGMLLSQAHRPIGAALFLGAAGTVGLALLLLLALDLIGLLSGPVRLDEELTSLAHTDGFQRGISRLAGPDAPPADHPWTLRLHRVLSRRHTHVSFEATASCNDRDILLWGKRYLWAGQVRSLERLSMPAYASATWAILHAMSDHRIPGAQPVACRKLRRFGLTVGSILLAEHLGDVLSLKDYLKTRAQTLTPDQRRAIVSALAGTVRRLHAAGIYDFPPRYFRLAGTGASHHEMRIYVFDLDKAHFAPRAPRWVRCLCRCRDLRRLTKCLRKHTPPEEHAALETLFHHGACATAEPAPRQ